MERSLRPLPPLYAAFAAWLPLCALAQAADPPWLVRVESAYQDEGRRALVVGTGFVIESADGKRAYVATAAHVSQGAEPRLFSGARELRVSGRLSRNSVDLELFELAPGESPPPLARFRRLGPTPGDAVFELLPAWSGRLGTLSYGGGVFRLESRRAGWPVLPVARLELASPAKAGDHEPAVWDGFGERDGSFSYHAERALLLRSSFPALVPIASWVRRPPVAGGEVPGRLEFSLLGNERVSPVEVIGGQSGSPVLEWVPLPSRVGEAAGGALRFLPVVGGVASRKSRYFRKSWFSSPQLLALLFEDHERGLRGQGDDVRWRLRRGVTYRCTSDDLCEAGFDTGYRGNGLSSDGGNQGVRNGQDPERIFGDLGVLPGVLVGGKQALGAYLREPGEPGQREALPVFLGWSELLLFRSQLTRDPQLLRPDDLPTLALRLAGKRRRARQGGCGADHNQLLLRRLSRRVELQAEFFLPGADQRVRFGLSSRAAEWSEPELGGVFLPVSSLRLESHSYTVDSRGLFFVVPDHHSRHRIDMVFDGRELRPLPHAAYSSPGSPGPGAAPPGAGPRILSGLPAESGLLIRERSRAARELWLRTDCVGVASGLPDPTGSVSAP